MPILILTDRILWDGRVLPKQEQVGHIDLILSVHRPPPHASRKLKRLRDKWTSSNGREEAPKLV
jgi:hypothetical protein